MALTPEQLQDFVKNTLQFFYKRNSWLDISLPLQHYIVASRFFKKAKMPVRGGQFIQESVQVANAGTYRHTGLYNKSTKVVIDHMQTIQTPFTKNEVHWTYAEDEDAFQSGPETIVRTIKVRQHSMWNDWFEGMETDFWTKPADENVNPRRPYGVPTWIVKDTTAGPSKFGFNGRNPVGWPAGVGKLSSLDYPHWANGTFKYATPSQDDLWDKLSEACHKCYFDAPHNYNEVDNAMPRYGLYTTYPVLEAAHKQLAASNDNLGIDLGKYRDQVLFKGHPIRWVPALTNPESPVRDVSNPIYGIDWDCFHFAFKKGWDRRFLPTIRLEEQPNVLVHYMQSWCNYFCTNRRKLFVGNSDSFQQAA